MKTLLVVTRWYFPAVKSGGPLRSTSALVNGLKNKFDISIITSDRDLGATEPYENVVFNKWIDLNGINIVYLSKLNIEHMNRYIRDVNPDVIYLNSFFDITTQVIMLLKLRRKVKSKIILAPRGELAKGALSIKASKKKIYLFLYRLFNLSKGITFHVTSKEEAADVRLLFPHNEIEIIQNISDGSTESYTLPLKELGKLKMVFISRISPKKNLLYGLEVLSMNDFEGMIEFDIYGPDEDKAYWRKCQELIEDLPSNVIVNYKGFVDPKEIALTLSHYHLFFLPTKGENFGHAIVEAMQVGVLPLISDQTPWTKLEDKKAGYSLSLDEKEQFVLAIQEMLRLSNEVFLERSNNIKAYVTKKIDSTKALNTYGEFFNK